MRALLYRPSWQALRVSFLHEHRSDGGWTTWKGANENTDELLKYVNGDRRYFDQIVDESKAMQYGSEHEKDARLYRTINCLNAVRMGYSGQGLKGSEQDKLVLEVRNHLQSLQGIGYHRNLTFALVRWDWRVVKKELAVQYDKADGLFGEVYKNLSTRQAKALSRATRPELAQFLKLMDEVQDGE